MRAGASRGREAALGQGAFLSHRTAAAFPLLQNMPELLLLPLVTQEMWGRACPEHDRLSLQESNKACHASPAQCHRVPCQ